MEYTLEELLENVQFTDLVHLDKYLIKVAKPKNGRYANIEDVVTKDICKYFVINIKIPTEEYIEHIFYQWHTREDVENFIQSCISMLKAAIVFNPFGTICQEKNKDGVYMWCADDIYEFYGYNYKTNKWAGSSIFCTYRYWKKDNEMTNLWDISNEQYWNPALLDNTSLNMSSNEIYKQCITRVFDNADEMIKLSEVIYEIINSMIIKIINNEKEKLTNTYNKQIDKLNMLINKNER